ncbi:hypothetical protein C8R48DRAFT_133210 [Suillus tomentosus]|nr:hypothetical protein C8R48DRAFT_133210 [Suillus tomentosus]
MAGCNKSFSENKSTTPTDCWLVWFVFLLTNTNANRWSTGNQNVERKHCMIMIGNSKVGRNVRMTLFVYASDPSRTIELRLLALPLAQPAE